ncbi:hypothetical protein FRC11_012244 [Ceratobasidium sp. 423]|nr:hypothetical protein FRC11_012244 [Ceratobasidium sp. 423]
MPSHTAKSYSEESIAQNRQSYFVGRFKVLLNQTQNHADQRALDQSWVNSLAEHIGTPEALDRAVHPIGVILKDDSKVQQLQELLTHRQNKFEVLSLPPGIIVLVFAGQHRLAMLAQLDLPGPDSLWWHADVYMNALERNHPADFLVMMHESNTPQVMKHVGDVDLFRAVSKLQKLLDAQSIDWETFLHHRRSLLGFDKNLARSISSLTRNKDLSNAITDALSRAHIASVFSAGSWRRLATGRLYMVATGLVLEMTAQVDLLTEGMCEVPSEVLSLAPSRCTVSALEGAFRSKKKTPHPWDALPGEPAAALARVQTRPAHFVSKLNPKKEYPWSFPEMVLLPSCLGGSHVEQELKLMQRLMQHLLKMTARKEDLDQYTTSQPDSSEANTRHPAAIIARILRLAHKSSTKVEGYENRIIQQMWKERAQLQAELQLHNIPNFETASKDDYERLLKESKPWWQLLNLFKIRHFPLGLRLEVPKLFASDQQEHSARDGSDGQQQEVSGDVTTVPPVPSTSQGSKRPANPLALDTPTSTKRPRVNLAKTDHSTNAPSNVLQTSSSSNMKPRVNTEETTVSDSDSYGNNEPMGGDQAVEINTKSLRKGDDRRLAQAIDGVKLIASDMSRHESRALTKILNYILEAKSDGHIEETLNVLLHEVESQKGSLAQHQIADTEEEEEEEEEEDHDD